MMIAQTVRAGLVLIVMLVVAACGGAPSSAQPSATRATSAPVAQAAAGEVSGVVTQTAGAATQTQTASTPFTSAPLTTTGMETPAQTTATSSATAATASTPAPPTTVTRGAANASLTSSAAAYIDDRSAPAQVVRSLYNAINRQEYARAYSYWEAGAPGLRPFTQFQQGYATTQSVHLTVGTVRTGAATGNLYGRVPVRVIATTTGGGRQTFVGCYTTHLGEPANQAVPPFHPMAIQSAHVQQVPNDANTTVLMHAICDHR